MSLKLGSALSPTDFFYAFLSSFVASPVSVPNSSKIQNTAAVASLNNPPSNQNVTRKTKAQAVSPENKKNCKSNEPSTAEPAS